MPISLQQFLADVIRDYGLNGKTTITMYAEKQAAYEVQIELVIGVTRRTFVVDGDMVFDVTRDNASSM